MAFLTKLCGAALIVTVLLDVFMTVLYARTGTGPFSHPLATGGWRVAKWLSRRVSRYKDLALSFFGPLYLAGLVTL